MNKWVTNHSVKINVTEIAYHRNGISGNGFHVVSFLMKEGQGERKMVGILFDEPGSCAVLDADLVGGGVIEFTVNSWRGDNFEDLLRQAIKDKYGEE